MVVRASVTHVDTSVVPHGPASPKYAKFSGGVLNRAARILGYVEEGQIRAIQGATGWLLHGSVALTKEFLAEHRHGRRDWRAVALTLTLTEGLMNGPPPHTLRLL